MPTVWQLTTYPFTGAATVAPADIDGFVQDGAFGATYYCMQKNGSGEISNVPARLSGAFCYATRDEGDLEQIVGIKFTARTPGTPATIETAVAARHRATTVGSFYRESYLAQVTNGGVNFVRVVRGGTVLASASYVMTPGTTYVLTLKTVPNGASTDLTARLYLHSAFNYSDPEAGTPLATATTSDNTALLQTVGKWGPVCLGSNRTSTDWTIDDAMRWTVLADAEGPALAGANVSQDGKRIICEFAEATLPLVATGGSSPTVDGLTVQARPGITGAWTTYAHSGGTIITDALQGARFVGLTTTDPIPRGYDVQVSYARSSGNLFDSVPGTPNEAVDKTVFAGNYSRVQTAARTGDQNRLLGTRGWALTTSAASTTGKEAQCTREIVLPYGCSADGLQIVYSGYNTEGTSGLVLRILAAGVRAITPSGTVSTHTLSFSGSGTTTIAYNAHKTAVIAQAFPPGTKIYATTWYKEESGGLLPYQWLEPVTEPHAGTGDGNAVDVGNIGTLSSKILLGGTPSGPSHSAIGALFGGADNRAGTYGPAFVYGKPYEYFSGDADAFACVGNSKMVHTGVCYSIPDRAFGDHQDPLTVMPYITLGVQGTVVDAFYTDLNKAIVQLVMGSNASDCLINWSLEGYGHNDVRADGRPTYGPQELDIWDMKAGIAAVFQARGTNHLTWDITPIEASPWLAWNSSDDPLAQAMICAFNRLIATRYAALPAVGFVNTSAIGGATYNGGFPVGRDAPTTITNDSLGYENDLWAAGSSTDGIHDTPSQAYAVALATRAEYQRVKSAGTGGGSSSGSGGDETLTIFSPTREVTATTAEYELLAQDGDVVEVQVRGDGEKSSAQAMLHFKSTAPLAAAKGLLIEANELTSRVYTLDGGLNMYGRAVDAGQTVTFVLNGAMAELP